MFPKALLLALLSLSAASSVLARPTNEFGGFGGFRPGNNQGSGKAAASANTEQCATAVSTVTVTAAATAAATSAAATLVSVGGKSGNAGKTGSSSSGKTGSSSTGKTGNNAGKGSAAGNNNKGGNNAGTGAAAGNNKGSTSSSSAAAAATSSAASSGSNAGSDSNDGGDPQKSLTLDPRVIAKGFEDDGQDVPAAGQVASLTSSNNFINYCLTVPNLPITNGQQVKTGSCNPAPMGIIAATTAMPSSKFTFPTNFGTIKANTAFTVTMAIANMETGHFVNANENYFSAPQQVNAQGLIQGHSHIVIEQIDSFAQTKPTDPTRFAFFKGLNDAAQGGVLSADVTAGLPAGFYRLASINTAANHQPVLVAIAQHGSLDDQIYFQVTDDGAPAAGSNSTGAASSSAAAASATKAAGGAAGKGGAGKKGGKN